jgi:pyruvate/oxaloacetate carboxyltransferase
MSATLSQTQPRFNQLVLRDGQQSTLKPENINFNPIDWAKILSKTSAAGFQAAEVAGGQSFQSAIKQGLNPFNVMEYLDLSTRDANGKRTIDLQMLFRGANALGFRHYSPDLIEAVLNEFTGLGINKIRIFDALNDIDNIYIPESLIKKTKLEGENKVELQGALCFGHYDQAPDRYSDDYYLNYAQALLKKGCTSIAIKDMSGQLNAERATDLIKTLKAGLPSDTSIELHIHSTDEQKSLDAIKAAIAAGINGIETVEGPLSGGAAHHSLASIDDKYNTSQYDALVAETERVFVNSPREDIDIDPDIKAKLCAAGVPGGAMPFVLADLKQLAPNIAQKNEAFFKDGYDTDWGDLFQNKSWLLNKSIELFLQELPRVCKDAGYPLLVTPTADICTKQAIWNLRYGKNIQSDKLEDRYDLTTGRCEERFVKLILGHYGQMKSYKSVDDKTFEQPSNEVREFFNTNNKLGVTEITEHPYLAMLAQHTPGNGELAAAKRQADKLIEAYGYKALSFASRDQIAIMYLLPPQGGNGDKIKQALDQYIAKTKNDSYELRPLQVLKLFEGFEYLFEPLFKHIDVLAALGRKPENPVSMQISDFGKLGERMYQVYSNLPQVTKIQNFLDSNFSGLEHKTEAFQTNYKALKDSFDTLFKKVGDFGTTKLQDLIIDLVKLDNITHLIPRNRQMKLRRESDFIARHLENPDKIAGIGKRLAANYFPALENQKQWQVNTAAEA